MRRFSIRNKLFFSFSLLGLLALATSFYFVYSNSKKNLQTAIHSELENSTILITTLVRSVASSSIENHLKTIAETQLEMVSGMYQEFRDGRFKESEAKELAAKLLLQQDIGDSGYIYCLDSLGHVPVHRDKKVENSNVSSFQFVQDQMSQKNGYLEYRWRNPNEPEEREKALYMAYFEPWDWIISATAYKSEFSHLIDINNIRKALSQIRFGVSGYSYIIDTSGHYIYHPALTGNAYDLGMSQEQIATIERILEQKQGKIYYQWKNPGEREEREKISILSALDEYNWLIGSSAYLDEIYQPLSEIHQTFLIIFIAYGGLILLATFSLSTLFTKPLKTLTIHFKNQAVTDVKPVTANFSNDEAGTLAGYLNQFIDKLHQHHQMLEEEITERLRSEKALRESEQTFHTLFDHSFQFIALLDTECRVSKINKTALGFRNLEQADILGQYFWDTPWWSHSETLVRQLKEAFTLAMSGQVARFEAHSNQLREIYLDISLKPVLDDEQQVIFIVAEARDITDVRRAESELQQAQKMESIGTLAGGIAHDFNNILGGILGTLALLKLKRDKGQQLTEEQLFGYLDTITETALRAKDIVNQLLTLSRKYDLEFKPVNLHDILQNVCQMARNSFDKSISFDIDFAEQIPVDADANSLEQVFLNLCINAAHAMTIMRPAGDAWGGTLGIKVSKIPSTEQTEESGPYWQIAISDTGIGIDDAGLKQIFTPFFTTKSKETGSGLGLSMVYSITKQHKGFIAVESSKGSGSTFIIQLPVSTAIPQIAENPESKPLQRGEGLILVVDDEELIRSNAAEILKECGYSVITAENGQLGIELYQQQSEIQAVLLDLVMPVMAGKETFENLKRLNPEVKVLLSSGFRQDARVTEVLEAGAAGFIQKPYSPHELSETLKKVLG